MVVHRMTSDRFFVQTLKKQAAIQSKLNDNKHVPAAFKPLMALVGVYPWQSLLIFSFICAWLILLFQFEFFFTLVHNIQ